MESKELSSFVEKYIDFKGIYNIIMDKNLKVVKTFDIYYSIKGENDVKSFSDSHHCKILNYDEILKDREALKVMIEYILDEMFVLE